MISIDIEKSTDKMWNTFMMQTLNKLGMEETYFNVIKAIYDKHTSYSMVKGWKFFLYNKEQDKDACSNHSNST